MICNYAHSKKVRLLIDAEEFEVQEAIDNLVYKMMKKYNRKSTIVYNTFNYIDGIEFLTCKTF